MARDPDDHPLAQLDAALRVEPSAAAAARVRERVRQEPVRASSGWWLVAAASVALVAVGLASSILITSRREPAPPAAVVATGQSPPVDAVANAVPKSVPSPAEARVTRTPPRLANARQAVVFAPVRPREAEVLVPPDEGIALRKLLMAVREGRATVPTAGLRVGEDADGHMLAPSPIEIPSIKIELLPGTPVGGSGGTVK